MIVVMCNFRVTSGDDYNGENRAVLVLGLNFRINYVFLSRDTLLTQE